MSKRFVWLILLAIGLAGCVAPVPAASLPSTPPPLALGGDDALRQDAEAMAKSLGVPLEEAMRQLQQQDDIGRLNAILEAKEAATFAGLWIEHTPRYRVVVAFTRDGEQTIRPYIANTPLAGIVEVRTVKATLAELRAAQEKTIDLVNQLDLNVASSISVQENRVEVYVTDRQIFEETLQKANARLPEHVLAVIVYEPLRSIPFPLTPAPGIHFPQLKMRSATFMAALATGKLVVKDGCLRIGGGDGSEGAVIIWQPDYFLNDNQGTLEVLDRNGKVVARVGEELRMGGGEGQLSPEWQRQLREPLPAECKGPYWIMGEIIP